MNIRNIATMLAATITIAGCGGGGSGSTVAPPQPTTPTPPVIEVPPKTVAFASGLTPWFHTQQAGVDGNEVLVLSTIDSANVFNLSAPTPMYMLKLDSTGVVDATAQLFDSTPKTYWSRNLVPFVDDTGAQAIYVCNQGRETSNPTSSNGVDGVWAEQDRLLVMRNGKYVDETSKLPKAIDFTHGCAVASMGDGKKSLVKNRFGMATPTKSLLAYDGSNYVVTENLDNAYAGGETGVGTFAVAAADFTRSGVDDVVFGTAVIRKTGSKFATAYVLPTPPEFAQAGYTVIHNHLVADVNGDGYPDLIVTFSHNGKTSGGPAFLSGAKLGLYLNDKKGTLVYAPNALPAHGASDFGLTIRALDINFDGKLDIVTSGERYMFGDTTQSKDPTVRAVLIGDGQGNFSLKKLDDSALSKQCASACQSQVYFLKKSDGSFNVVAYGKSSTGGNIFYGRRVSADNPLTIQ